jgi:hypothetical protein
VRNVILQSEPDEDVQFWLGEVDSVFCDILDSISKGKNIRRILKVVFNIKIS